ncbi:DUF1116 domain-containing protein [Pelagibius sp.]|uniref:oxamate carbamoyltransferase subunit AllG family protein n=1 Tax=Pelagibius sp. TaxID=1931238 RepID=UPI00261623F5|nr:DUF1116 domain-containing protein [Pelagibius sp.]
MAGEALHPADRLACERMAASQPLWDCLEPAASAVGLEKQVLLHAGPPFASAAEITRPILNSACVAAVFEGLAEDFDAAEAMIAAGDIVLAPAQDHGVVTPLAAVVSASMPLHGVRSAGGDGPRVYTPINGGSRPSMRLGLREQAVLDHIRWLNGPFCETLQQGIGEGIALIPLAVAGLQAGDDCHGRTIAATEALVGELQAHTPGGIQDAGTLEFMASSPSLFLNLWMAATKCMMTAASGIDGSSFVTAAAGNGAAVGIQVSGLPGRWFTAAARPPKGPLDVDLPAERALGAIGDSAVVEAFGLGAMAFHLSPEQMQRLGPYLPPDSDARVASLLAAEHPGFQALGIRLGITARAAAGLGAGPVVGLGMLDREGHAGRIGGGIYDMPAAPFRDAVAALGG